MLFSCFSSSVIVLLFVYVGRCVCCVRRVCGFVQQRAVRVNESDFDTSICHIRMLLLLFLNLAKRRHVIISQDINV